MALEDHGILKTENRIQSALKIVIDLYICFCNTLRKVTTPTDSRFLWIERQHIRNSSFCASFTIICNTSWISFSVFQCPFVWKRQMLSSEREEQWEIRTKTIIMAIQGGNSLVNFFPTKTGSDSRYLNTDMSPETKRSYEAGFTQLPPWPGD